MTDWSDYPAKIVRDTKAKLSSAERSVEVGVAKAVGHAALDARGIRNVAAHETMRAAAMIAPRATMAAGVVTLKNSTGKQLEDAAFQSAGRAVDALRPTVQPFMDKVGAIERGAGKALKTGAETVFGAVNKAEGAMKRGVSGAASMFNSLRSKPAPASAAPAKAPAARKTDEVPMSSKGPAPGKQANAGSGEVKPYERYDPRAGRKVQVGGYNRTRNA